VVDLSQNNVMGRTRHDLFVWCCGSEEKEVQPFGGARRTARRRREGGGGGSRERRGACRGEILTRTQINAPSDIKTHLGRLDDRESNFYS